MKPLPYNKATRIKFIPERTRKLKYVVISLLLLTGCNCSKKGITGTQPTLLPPTPQQEKVWTWEKLNWGGLGAWAIAVEPGDGNTFYVSSVSASTEGIFKSTDGGKSFNKVWNMGTLGLAIDPNRPKVIYAACGNFGVWRSRDGGMSWNQLTSNHYAECVLPDRSDSNYIFAGPWRSTDYGLTWTLSIPYIMDPSDIKAIVQGSQNPFLLYADQNYIATRLTLKSLDKGATWTAVDGGGDKRGYNHLAIDPYDNQKVYGGVFYPNPSGHRNVQVDSLLRTTDGGANWETFPIGQDTLEVSDVPVAVDPRQGFGYILYAGGNGVYRSEEYGKTWKKIGLGGFWVRDIAVSPTVPSGTTVVYVVGVCSDGPCDRLYRGSAGR